MEDTVLTSSKTGTWQLVDCVLQDINGETGLPVRVHYLSPSVRYDYGLYLTYKPDSYVIFIVPVKGMRSLYILQNQMMIIALGKSFNPQAKFLFVVTGCFANINHFLNRVIYKLWDDYKIFNVVFMIPRRDSQGCDVNDDMYGSVDTRNIDIYSWFPYKGNYCADNFDAVLLDQCGSETLDTSLHNVSLFTNEIPHKFSGCPTTAYVQDVKPYVIRVLTDNFTDSGGHTVLRFSGIIVKYLSLVTEALNLTLKYTIHEYLPHIKPIVLYAGFKQLKNPEYGTQHTTTPFIFDTIKWFVPCPKSALRTDRLLNLFSSSIWFTMLLVILLTAFVFWSSVRLLFGAVMKESYGYRTVVHCLYNVWCVFMGVAVPEMARTWRVRALFVLFVWYSFAMSTIFGSFFTSFLEYHLWVNLIIQV
jgi:hypothetical protein